ncbi:MAG: ATP-binding protein [Candidatus Nomurabacteria bacterium]|jgi:predicted AAA+ superfamily ATPase|nr:ATP-binding protein [Candidatus Nomurabacteria bacterium]
MIKRTIESEIKELLAGYPVVTLTGPRQSGKSTLLTEKFSNFEYVSLEDVDLRQRAKDDPRGFLEIYSAATIIDEVQYVTELFSYIQTKTDQSDDSGQYILSGSQNFLLMKKIKQSLAGRVGIAKLLPFSYFELSKDREISETEFIFKGGYPRIYDKNLDVVKYYDNYISTYLDRDIKDIIGINNITDFNRFLTLCATRVGQLLNVANLSADTGISVNTAKEWLSVLESSYVIKLIPPYFKNIPKRLVKSPKVCFFDTGLLCHLLGIESVSDMKKSKYYGNIFENYVFSEFFKSYYNSGRNNPKLFFYRDSNGNEVDLVEELSIDRLRLFEIKASKTIKSEFSYIVNEVGDLLGASGDDRFVIGQFDKAASIDNVRYVGLNDGIAEQ